MKPIVNRRTFLAGLGVGGALLPLLPTEKALGQNANLPKRLLVVCWTNGYIMDAWRPQGSETDFTLGEILSPLEKLKSKLLVVDGLGQRVHYEADAGALGWGKDQWYGGHDGYPGVLTGVPCKDYRDFFETSGGDSIDQYIANELSAAGQSLSFKSLVVGPYATGGYSGCISYNGVGTEGITPESDPFNLFKTMFEGRNLPKGELDKARAVKKSVLDYLNGSLTAFSSRMGTEDKAKIESHLAAVREIEKQLETTITLDCTLPTLPASFDTHDDISNYPKALKVFSDLLVAGFRCDLTRVASLTLTDVGGDGLVFSWLGDEFTGPGDEYPIRQYHDITHRAGQSGEHTRRKIRVEQWFHEQVAYIAEQLEATPEGSGTMLDNTLIVITNDMGINHDSKVQPFTLIGNLDGYFRTGRSLKYPVSNDMGTAHNQLFVSLANAMGVDGSKFGAPRYAQELPGLKA